MSSTTGLSRTRSIRNPAARENETVQNNLVHGRKEARNVSPSRLPMRPPTTRSTTSATSASSSTTTTRTRAPTGLTSRQPSGSSSIKARVPSRSAENEASATATAKPLTRAQSVRQPPPTTTRTATPSNGIARSASTIVRPRSSSGFPATGPPRERHLGHSRAKSTVTSLTAATTLRPLPQVPSRSNPSPAPSTASSTSTNTTTKTTTTSSTRAQTRSQTQHARVPSQSQSQSSTTASNLAARRPAFNTNQKHYSPAKSLAPKPLTSTFLAPPSPSKQPANVALTAETSRLQTELLQLSLLHREAHAVSASWHASARSKLEARFKELVAADQTLQALEREGAEARGLQDLIRWGNANPDPLDENEGQDVRSKTQGIGGIREGDGNRRNKERNKLPLDEKVQLLDQVLNGVWALGEPGGRYQRTVSAFEEWAFQVAEIRAAQRGDDLDGLLARGNGGGFELGDREEENASIFVSDLDVSAWKRDHAGLVRMLEGWQRTLAQLGHVHADSEDKDVRKDSNGTPAGDTNGNKPLSGLARTLLGCRSLVRDMLAELQVMEQIELDALAAEEEWMEQIEARLNADEEAGASRRRRTGDVVPWKLLAL
ncbi:hypothetical protein GGR58DRAFT_453410 [Xylaria digitata]|nr:hypothetical protein GGR58DRAFT_453410 [Xylaria digitata]